MKTKIKEFIEQVEMNDYEDSLGHPLKNNINYIGLKKVIEDE